MINEVWVSVDGHVGYMVSNMGRVRSLDRYVDGKLGSKRFHKGRIIKPFKSSDGYYQVDLNEVTHRVHRLVAKHFISNELGKKEVNHKDRCRTNNCVDNLEWVTLQENQEHSWDNGRVGNMNGRFGFDHNKSHPVIAYVDGIMVDIYGSIKEAGRELGVSDTVIGQSIKRNMPISKKSHKLCGYSFEKIYHNGVI
jgi:hypothetical protein